MLAANMSVGRDTPPLTELQLLHNEKFFLNLTQVLNISADNLTSLLHGLEPQDLLEQPQPTQATLPPMGLLATLSVCYALIFVAGVLGNLITCIVISRNNFMHTATNFYLFNLAISDLILLCSGRCERRKARLKSLINYSLSSQACHRICTTSGSRTIIPSPMASASWRACSPRPQPMRLC